MWSGQVKNGWPCITIGHHVAAKVRKRPVDLRIDEIPERPLLAESSPSLHSNFDDLNDCFREKRPFAQYVEWMREHREIFEFVDDVGCYGSGWWLDVA